MGMFNTILSDLMCPKREEIARDTEIQCKWQAWGFRVVYLNAADNSIGPKTR